MTYYDTFVKASISPKNKWKMGLQAFVDSSFSNASTYQEGLVEEEASFGTLEFKPIVVRVNQLVDAKTGQRINDDFKKLIFPDLEYHPPLGTRYRFENNIWIVYSIENIMSDTASVYVRRCNNVMTTQDKYGNVHREPIIIDYKVTENQIFRNYNIDVPSGRIQILCQLNEWTKNIGINDRYIFGDDVYKIRERSRFDRRYTFDEGSIGMISFYADYDNIGENDNGELGIADYRTYDFTITSAKSISNIAGFSDKLDYNVCLNDVDTDEPAFWTSTDESIATINKDTGEYTLLKVGSCKFIATMKNKIDVFVEVPVTVERKIVTEYEDILSPEVDTIRLNKTVDFSIYETVNGEQTDTHFSIKAYNVPSRNYQLRILNNNNFSITNLKPCDEDLKLVCTNLNRKDENGNPIQTIAYIRLGGII